MVDSDEFRSETKYGHISTQGVLTALCHRLAPFKPGFSAGLVVVLWMALVAGIARFAWVSIDIFNVYSQDDLRLAFLWLILSVAILWFVEVWRQEP